MAKCKKCQFSEKRKGINYECKLNTCRSPYCWMHSSKKGIPTIMYKKNSINKTPFNFKYRIKKSNVPNAGFGLFYEVLII